MNFDEWMKLSTEEQRSIRRQYHAPENSYLGQLLRKAAKNFSEEYGISINEIIPGDFHGGLIIGVHTKPHQELPLEYAGFPVAVFDGTGIIKIFT